MMEQDLSIQKRKHRLQCQALDIYNSMRIWNPVVVAAWLVCMAWMDAVFLRTGQLTGETLKQCAVITAVLPLVLSLLFRLMLRFSRKPSPETAGSGKKGLEWRKEIRDSAVDLHYMVFVDCDKGNKGTHRIASIGWSVLTLVLAVIVSVMRIRADAAGCIRSCVAHISRALAASLAVNGAGILLFLPTWFLGIRRFGKRYQEKLCDLVQEAKNDYQRLKKQLDEEKAREPKMEKEMPPVEEYIHEVSYAEVPRVTVGTILPPPVAETHSNPVVDSRNAGGAYFIAGDWYDVMSPKQRIARGDELFAQKKYEEAMVAYNCVDHREYPQAHAGYILTKLRTEGQPDPLYRQELIPQLRELQNHERVSQMFRKACREAADALVASIREECEQDFLRVNDQIQKGRIDSSHGEMLELTKRGMPEAALMLVQIRLIIEKGKDKEKQSSFWDEDIEHLNRAKLYGFSKPYFEQECDRLMGILLYKKADALRLEGDLSKSEMLLRQARDLGNAEARTNLWYLETSRSLGNISVDLPPEKYSMGLTHWATGETILYGSDGKFYTESGEEVSGALVEP